MSKEKGDKAEDLACLYLKDNSFKIIERNFYAKKLGEIDIVASKDSIYHFIEVKSAQDYETAVNNISPSKLSKLIRSVSYYLQSKDLDKSFCIDAIIVVNEKVEYIENITI